MLEKDQKIKITPFLKVRKRHKKQKDYVKFVKDVPVERQLEIERERIKKMEESENGNI